MMIWVGLGWLCIGGLQLDWMDAGPAPRGKLRGAEKIKKQELTGAGFEPTPP